MGEKKAGKSPANIKSIHSEVILMANKKNEDIYMKPVNATLKAGENLGNSIMQGSDIAAKKAFAGFSQGTSGFVTGFKKGLHKKD